jgi:hypothetical protein
MDFAALDKSPAEHAKAALARAPEQGRRGTAILMTTATISCACRGVRKRSGLARGFELRTVRDLPMISGA